MTAETKLAASKGVHPIRTSPAVGSARNSIFFTALAQVVEHGRSAIEQGATVLGRLDPLGGAIEQTHANVCSSSAIDLEMADCAVFRSAAALSHAASLHDGHQDVKVVQLHPASDAIAHLHRTPPSLDCDICITT